jgi:hypothetical protein
VLAKLIYAPVAVVLGLGAAKAADAAFDRAWERSHGTKVPGPRTEEATWGQVLGAAALEAATYAVTVAVAQRAGAKAFRYLTGYWPGDKAPEPARQIEPRSG